MSIGNDNADAASLFIEIRPGMRKALADAVEAFLNLLDQIDADANLEEDNPSEDDAPCEEVGDNEPSLGTPGESSFPPQTHWAQGADDDREVEDEHDEPGGDEEPALGWSDGHGHPEMALRGYGDDREHDDEREEDHDFEEEYGR